MIPVTRPCLPSYDRYAQELRDIWDKVVLTNHGPKQQRLESELKKYLQIPDIYVVANGTLALQVALRALNIEGKALTTPFSYVATTSSIVWENLEPAFVDVRSDDFTIDARLVETRLQEDRSIRAIVATHVYGQPCEVQTLDKISKKYGIPVIYDAAHAFGVRLDGRSILDFGSISTLSFHATKVFHTVEGGAVVSREPGLMEKMRLCANFGHLTPESFDGVGINAKISEFHAAMGICMLEIVTEAIQKRARVCAIYDGLLFSPSASTKTPISKPQSKIEHERNFAYYPIVFESANELLAVRDHLLRQGISTRRYFYPSLNTLSYVHQERCPISEDVCQRVLCLPLYPDLTTAQAEWIGSEVRNCLG